MVKSGEIKQETTEKVIDTNVDAKNAQTKCPKCGSTDIAQNKKTDKLRCNFCRHEFNPAKLDNITEDIKNLKGKIIGSGSSNIIPDSKDIVTYKCSSCGAEVVIDTKSSLQGRCHWCRNMLSLNKPIANGAVPDMVLPFKVTKEEARDLIDKYVGKYKFYAHPTFRKEFTSENVLGVYLPYVVVDINAHANLKGMGEIQTRRYQVKRGDHYDTRYDADVYSIERDYDIAIHDITLESNIDKLDYKDRVKTTNIINSIMPFDIENAQKWDANFLSGFTSEKRDTNITDLSSLIESQAKDITRFKTLPYIQSYDRGVKWTEESLKVIGEQWITAYLPVWVYSYHQKKGDKHVIHYVAVNARTKENRGSIPVNIPKLLIVSSIIEVLMVISMIFVSWEYDFIFLVAGIIYYFVIYSSYRQSSARHTYEVETKVEISNMKSKDTYLKAKNGQSSSRMSGSNETAIRKDTYNSLKKEEENK